MLPMLPGTGWIPDPPDERDFVPESDDVEKLLRPAKALLKNIRETAASLPPSVDLAPFFPPVVDQYPLNSCTAAAATALLGYLERKAFRKSVAASMLFLYKVERNLLGQRGDGGAFLRTAMQALRTFGVPPDEYWPNHAALLDVEPTPFLYAFAANYKATSYYRVANVRTPAVELLQRVKASLANSLPAMFGFVFYASIGDAGQTGRIPLPFPWEPPAGLHAMAAVGYDDHEQIVSFDPVTGRYGVTTGALKIRNSWGTQWGAGGYGWLPYDYVRAGLTSDWWVLMKSDYLDTGEFGPGTAPERARPAPSH